MTAIQNKLKMPSATNVSDEKQEDSIAEEEAPDTVGEEILQAEGEEREEAEKE